MRSLLLVGLALAVAGCDRVPIDTPGTRVRVVGPDLDVVFVEPDLRLRLAPEGPSEGLTVRIRLKVLDFDSTQGLFVYDRELAQGLNVFPLSVTDADGRVVHDTLYTVHLPLAAETVLGQNDGVAREAAAGALLGPERLLVTGGADATGAARATGSLVRVVNGQVASDEFALADARVGHSATPVADGVLLLGGASRASPGGAADFVTTAEWIGPGLTAEPVEVVGASGPARMGHVARAVEADGETYVYLLGGRVPRGNGAAVTETVEVYRVLVPSGPDRDLRLERVSPPGGASGFAALADGALVSTAPWAATVFGLADGEGTALSLAWSLPGTATFPLSLRVAPAAGLQAPRAAAATVDLGSGLALVTGGRGPDGTPVGTLEVYAAEAGRSFRFPPSVRLAVPRSGHVATILADGRILVIGGRPASGGPVVAAEAFRL